jgi:hypothetical protein
MHPVNNRLLDNNSNHPRPLPLPLPPHKQDPRNSNLRHLRLLQIIPANHPMKTSIPISHPFFLLTMRPTWGRKTSTTVGTTSAGTATLVNRATTPQTTNSRTNSPTPAQPPNAWTAKADERHSHDQFTHLLYTLLVPIPLPLPLHARDQNSDGRVNPFYCIQEEEHRILAFSLISISNPNSH